MGTDLTVLWGMGFALCFLLITSKHRRCEHPRERSPSAFALRATPFGSDI